MLILTVIGLLLTLVIAVNNYYGIIDRLKPQSSNGSDVGLAQLIPVVEIESHSIRDKWIRFTLNVGVINQGTKTATATHVTIRLPNRTQFAQYGLDGNGNDGMPRIPTGGKSNERKYGNTSSVVHPGSALMITAVTRGFQLPNPSFDDIEIEFVISHDNSGAEIKKASIEASALTTYVVDRQIFEV